MCICDATARSELGAYGTVFRADGIHNMRVHVRDPRDVLATPDVGHCCDVLLGNSTLDISVQSHHDGEHTVPN